MTIQDGDGHAKISCCSGNHLSPTRWNIAEFLGADPDFAGSTTLESNLVNEPMGLPMVGPTAWEAFGSKPAPTSRMAVNARPAAAPPPTTMPGDAGSSTTQYGFRISTRKMPILKAEPIEQMTASLGIAPPEMIFGDNMVTIEHAKSGFGVSFNTYDALDRVDKTGGSMLQVAHSREWQSTR